MPKNNDPYVREGWVGYRVVMRIQPVETRTQEEILLSKVRQGQGLQCSPSWDLGQQWNGPLTVVAESEENWVVRSESGNETLLRKDQVIFLSVGDEKA